MAGVNMIKPYISVCIPVYKNLFFLKRLLDSLKHQSFRNFEIIITDDSPDDDIKDFCVSYDIAQPILYFKNEKSLGTPENWNESIRRSRGEWVKLMHDDDWLANDDALKVFAEYTHKEARFIFSSYESVFSDSNTVKSNFISPRLLRLLRRRPEVLLAGNLIGPPSVGLCRKDSISDYDSRLKWLVDIECYMRQLKKGDSLFINKVLVNVGVNDAQVTAASFGVKGIELPEYMYVLEKHGRGILRSMNVYDAYWRMIRNLKVCHNDLLVFEINAKGMRVIKSMVRWQKIFPRKLLITGFVSKAVMIIHYLVHRSLL